jgi:type II secretion system protein J
MTSSPPRARPNGFTLIEITIAVTILGVLLFAGYSALSNISWGKKIVDDKRELRLIAAGVIHRLTRELQLGFGQIPLLPPRDNLDKPYPPKIVFLAESSTLDTGAPGDSITFMTLEGGQYLPDGGRHSGVVQVTYRLDREEGVSSGPYHLVREETPHIRPPKKAYSKTMIFPITNAMTSLDFSFYDDVNSTWVETWGTEGTDGLPRLVKIRFTVRSALGDERAFGTIVAIRSAAREQQ